MDKYRHIAGYLHSACITLTLAGLILLCLFAGKPAHAEQLPGFLMENAPKEFQDSNTTTPNESDEDTITKAQEFNSESEAQASTKKAEKATPPKETETNYAMMSNHWEQSLMYSKEQEDQLRAVWDAYEQQRVALANMTEDEAEIHKSSKKSDFLSRILGDIKKPSTSSSGKASKGSGSSGSAGKATANSGSASNNTSQGKSGDRKQYGGADIGNLFINSIVYYTPEKWAVWINHEKFTPHKLPEKYEIDAVEPGRIILRFHGSQALLGKAKSNNVPYLTAIGSEIYLSLAPYQSFLGSSGEVIEGQFFIPKPIMTGKAGIGDNGWSAAPQIENPNINMDKDLANRTIGLYREFQKMDPRNRKQDEDTE